MIGDIITIKECLELMESGQPFTVSYVTYDRTRKKGGEYRTISAKLLQGQGDTTGQGAVERPATEQEKLLGELSGHRNPNHQRWYTRNVVLLVDGHETSLIQSVHPPLFDVFNGKTVVS